MDLALLSPKFNTTSCLKAQYQGIIRNVKPDGLLQKHVGKRPNSHCNGRTKVDFPVQVRLKVRGTAEVCFFFNIAGIHPRSTVDLQDAK